MSSSRSEFWSSVLNRRMLICVFTGFASGLPFFVLIQMVQAWMQSGGVNLVEIGFFTLVQLPYIWKFAWAPLFDRYSLPFLGRRRGWLLIIQVALLVLISSIGLLDPREDFKIVVALALFVAMASATQDIVIDAYRRELLPDEELGWGNIVHVNAYRIAGILPGGFALILADVMPWSAVFVLIGSCMLIGIVMTLSISEIAIERPQPKGIGQSIVQPFAEFIQRLGLGQAGLILLFMIMYKLGDSMATALTTTFYLELGFSLTEVGAIAKQAALWPSIFGGIIGGLWMIKLGINRALWVFGFVQWLTLLGFVILSEVGANPWVLGAVISMEYLGVGLGTAAFLAFIARVTSPIFAAAQFALLTAVAALPRTVIGAFTGLIVEHVGWTQFYIICFLVAIPGLLMLFWVAPWNGENVAAKDSSETVSA